MKNYIILLFVLFPSFLFSQIPAIKLDQLGYLPGADKIAILSDPITGYNASESYTPGTTLQVRSAVDGTTVYSATPYIWNSGATHSTSGDKAWWFDFSSVTNSGAYYLHDPTNGINSDTFLIDINVYNSTHYHAFKSFYYQRCGASKTEPYCANGYADGACHVGALQDLDCRSIITKTAASSLDLSGGWHDAGDYNKYVNFLWATMTDLLLSFEYYPAAWSDDMDIPESGNYIPDLLDEVRVETDWLLKMQQASGGVLSIVGVESGGTSPPSADGNQRFYGPMTTSASFTAATIFALAAIQFDKIDCAEAQNYSSVLETAAIAAYNWAVANPVITFYNQNVVGAGEQETDAYSTDMRQLSAAIYLYAQTGTSAYKTYVESNYTATHMWQWNFVYPFESAIQHALLFYAHITGVTSAVATDIQTIFKNSVDNHPDNYSAHGNELDAYRAYLSDGNHGWGSNSVKMSMANIYQTYLHYNLDPAKATALENIILDYAHYIHGCNPNGLFYLTNFNSFGAERSINSIYHGWFYDGSALWDEVGISTYGPAPGFLSGGPNPGWSLDGCCNSDCGSTANNNLCVQQTPPANQPILKSYKDWNADWPQNSWSVTENAIYYQAAYLLGISSKVDRTLPAIIEAEDSRLDNADLFLSTPEKGIVLTSENGSAFLIYINNSGKILASSNTSLSTGSTKLEQSYLTISTTGKGIVLRSADGSYWRMAVDLQGKLTITAATAPGNSFVEQRPGDFSLDGPGQGIVLKNTNDDCFLLKVNDAGKIICLPIGC